MPAEGQKRNRRKEGRQKEGRKATPAPCVYPGVDTSLPTSDPAPLPHILMVTPSCMDHTPTEDLQQEV